MFKQLFLFVEGPDDERFCRSVVEPLVQSVFQQVKYILYAKMKSIEVAKTIKGIMHIPAVSYLFVHDLDEHPCVAICKEKILERFNQTLHPDHVIIVKREIESWYLAGVNQSHCRKFKKKYLKDTEKVNKEKFNALRPEAVVRTDFLKELLIIFSVEEAKERNNSFSYFYNKFLSGNHPH